MSSRDSRDHLEWLLAKLNGKDDAIAEIHGRGWQAYFFFYWSSYSGHGGPTLSPPQMKRLAELNLEISFDCYFLNDEEIGEQAGTGQPATRSESKPEGGDKPQPESEGRSR